MIRLAVRPGRPGTESSDHELEADVMRFVAIIALCIVAISTLVEDVAPMRDSGAAARPPAETTPPMVPAPPASPPASVTARAGGVVPITPRQNPPVPPKVSEPAPEPPATVLETPTSEPDRIPEPVAEPRPEPRAAPAEAVPQRAVERPDETVEQPPEPGFVLRFASDAALLRLVARGEAAVFVFDGAETLRLEYGDAGASFAPAPGPARYHAIAAATVPGLLRQALAGERRPGPGAVCFSKF